MTLLFGVPWLCTQFLWCCLWLSSQTGYNGAHGHSLNGENYVNKFAPQTSTQFNSGSVFDRIPSTVSPRDETQNIWHQSFVPLPREPVPSEEDEHTGSLIPSEDKLVQTEFSSQQEQEENSVVSSPPQEKQHVTSGAQHPFGILVKAHVEKNPEEGVSFPSITNFKQFIESMKNAFLTPGNDLSHFQTARQILEHESASASARNIKEDSSSEGESNHDAAENEVWKEPKYSVLGQSEQDANYNMPSMSNLVPGPVVSARSLISPRAYDNQDSGLGSGLYSNPQLEATARVSSFSKAGVSGQSSEPLAVPPDVQDEAANDRPPEKNEFPFSASNDEDANFSERATASPSQNLHHDSRRKSSLIRLTSEPKYTSHSESSPRHQTSSDGFEYSNFFQGDVTEDDADSLKKTQSLAKSVFDGAPRSQRPPRVSIPDQLPIQGVRLDAQDVNSPSGHLGVYRGSVILPWSAGSHNHPNQKFSRKDPLKSLVKPYTSSYDDQLRFQSVTHPIFVQAEDVAEPNPPKKILASVFQEPKHVTDKMPNLISRDMDSAKHGISSHGYFNSLFKLHPTSELKKMSRFPGDRVVSKNFENTISERFPFDRDGARKPSGLFAALQGRRVPLNRSYGSADGRLQPFKIPPRERKHPAVNKRRSKMVYQTPQQLPAAGIPGLVLHDVFRRNDGYRKVRSTSPQVKTHSVKSRGGYVISRVSTSKTQYTPDLLTEGESGQDGWKPKRNNFLFHKVKVEKFPLSGEE